MMKNCRRTYIVFGGSFLIVLLIVVAYCNWLPEIVALNDRALHAFKTESSEPCEDGGNHQGAQNQMAHLDMHEKCGLFGDSFGALTSVFSALAFWGALMTLICQFLQQQRDTEVKAKEHFPLIVQVPKDGVMSFYVDARGNVTLFVRIQIDEKNVSEDVALQIAHKMVIFVEGVRGKQWARKVNIFNHLIGSGELNRMDSVTIRDRDDIILFLEALALSPTGKVPKIKFSIGYRNFFNTYGKTEEVYKILLRDSDVKASELYMLIGVLKAGKVKTLDDVKCVLQNKSAVQLKLKTSFSDTVLKEISENEYKEFVK